MGKEVFFASINWFHNNNKSFLMVFCSENDMKIPLNFRNVVIFVQKSLDHIEIFEISAVYPQNIEKNEKNKSHNFVAL